MAGSSSAACRRAPTISRSTASAAEVPSATEARSVAVSIASASERLEPATGRVGDVMQPEAPRGLGQPRAGTLGPLHQNRVALGQEPFPIEVAGLVGGTEPIAVQVEDRPARRDSDGPARTSGW